MTNLVWSLLLIQQIAMFAKKFAQGLLVGSKLTYKHVCNGVYFSHFSSNLEFFVSISCDFLIFQCSYYNGIVKLVLILSKVTFLVG